MMWKYYYRTSILNSTSIFQYGLKVLFAIVLIAMMYDIVFGEYKYDEDYEADITDFDETAWIESQDAGNDADDDNLVNRLQQHKARRKEESDIKEKLADKELTRKANAKELIRKTPNDGSKTSVGESEVKTSRGRDALMDENNESYKILEELRKYEELLKFETLDEKEDFELRANKPTDLIINTYMRSGSTFIGNIFSKRSDTFYVYEPLWNVQKFAYYSGMHELCHYFQHRCSRPGRDAEINNIGSSVKIHDVLAFMNSLMNCDFSKNKIFLPDGRRFKSEFPHSHSWNFAKGQSWQTYFDCSKRHGATYDECFKDMRPVCRSKKHKVLKVLRTTLDNLEYLIKSRQNLKVIHLFRDPRGIINSHLHTPFLKNKVITLDAIEKDVETTCDRMRVDIQIALHLRRVYKGQFLVVQYEDFDDLLYNAKALYNFMKMDILPEMHESLENAKNGRFHPYRYSKTLPWKVERLVNKHCQGVLQALGYPVFNTVEEFRQFHHSPNLPKLPYSLSNSYFF